MAYSSRGTPAQWQNLIEQWQHSGQPATQFCKANEIGYVSFCKWRQRLSGEQAPAGPNPASQFIDLSALPSEAPHWHIVLNLGNGVELKLSQG